MKIGYVVKRYPRYSETFVVNEILAHEEAGLEVEIFSLRPPCDTHFQDAISRVRAPVKYLPDRGFKAADFWAALEEAGEALPDLWSGLAAARGEEARDVYQAVVLAREARMRGIDRLHAHFASSATSVARLAASFAGIPYTFTAHAKDIFHESVRPEDLGRKLADAEAVVTVSEYNLAYLRELYGEAAGRVRRVYNGLDLDLFPYEAPELRPPRIVAVGRLVEKKGFGDLIPACALLKERGLTFRCEIIGSGELEGELRASTERLGVGDVVELAGPVPQRDLAARVRDAAAFAAPCVVGADGNRDGLPTVLLEAMALGTPCVSTDVTGIPEAVRHGETGLIVPQHDPAALAAALERLLSERALRVRLASRARRLIESDFDVRSSAARLRSIFGAATPPEAGAEILQEVR